MFLFLYLKNIRKLIGITKYLYKNIKMNLISRMIRDNNDLNEKTIIGLVSFVIMIIFAIVDLVTAYFGKDFIINETIYNSFLILTLGSFGISSIDKYTNVKNRTDYQSRRKNNDNNNYEDEKYY